MEKAEESNSIIIWSEKLNRILSQHIYKQNDALKKVKEMAKELVSSDMISDFSYSDFLESRNVDLYEHLIFTALLSIKTGKHLGLSKDILDDIAFGCLIHDIGLRYISVPYKNSNLDIMSPKEMYEFKKHTILGYTSLENESWIPQNVKIMVLSHHEHQDGSGYPLKQKNKELECKILQICDSIDRTIAGIEVKKGTIQQAKKEIQENINGKYDSQISKVVLGLL